MQNYNLEYPDFYTKLYALLEPGVLFVKYRARFFYLLDLFMTSTYAFLFFRDPFHFTNFNSFDQTYSRIYCRRLCKAPLSVGSHRSGERRNLASAFRRQLDD